MRLMNNLPKMNSLYSEASISPRSMSAALKRSLLAERACFWLVSLVKTLFGRAEIKLLTCEAGG